MFLKAPIKSNLNQQLIKNQYHKPLQESFQNLKVKSPWQILEDNLKLASKNKKKNNLQQVS